MKTENTSLSECWQQLLASEPNLRIRDAAARLGVSEAELLATRCGNGVTRLSGDWQAFVKALPKLGRVMCLTRNESAVHERYGLFREVEFFGPPPGFGQVVGHDIDLRLFLSHWQVGFAVEDATKEGTRRSLQIFDAAGCAVHKVYLQEESDVAAYEELAAAYRTEDQSAAQVVLPAPTPEVELPDSEINVAAYQEEWLTLKDTHHFFMLLRKHRVAREQALRLAPEGYAWHVELSAIEQVLKTASATEMPIMVFIGNPGCLQIHTGLVKNIKWFGSEWLNVLDDEFNMHLRFSQVARAWVVRKPTKEEGVGYVTSLELFDAAGNNIALIFGKRKPGELEDEQWRQIAGNLPKLEVV